MAQALDICKANIDTYNDAIAVIDKAVANMRQVAHSETETLDNLSNPPCTVGHMLHN